MGNMEGYFRACFCHYNYPDIDNSNSKKLIEPTNLKHISLLHKDWTNYKVFYWICFKNNQNK